jgi:threonine aldolase
VGIKILGVELLVQPFEAAVATSSTHVNEDEFAAPEFVSGNKIFNFLPVDGTLSLDVIDRLRITLKVPHRVAPELVKLTQANEFETVYSLSE